MQSIRFCILLSLSLAMMHYPSIFTILLSTFIFVACKDSKPKNTTPPDEIKPTTHAPLRIAEAKKYARSKGFDTTCCLLIDMGMHSGLKRFFVVDLVAGRAIDSGMVSHGCGSKPWGRSTTRREAVFSNTPDSHCSSLGHYRIGRRGVSEWGIKVN